MTDAFVALCEQAERAAREGFDAFAELAVSLRALAASAELRLTVDEHVARLAAAPEYRLARCSLRAWTLAEVRGAALMLERIPSTRDEQGALLHGAATHRLIASVAQLVVLAHFRHPAGRGDVFQRDEHLHPVGEVVLRPGDAVALEAFRDVAEWSLAPDGAVALVLRSPAVYSQFWTYERATLEPVEPVSDDFQHNRIEHAVGLLATLGYTAAADVVAALYDHPAHHIRWLAVRATMELDPLAGAALLERAVHDPHPHVARAAARSLAALHGSTAS